MIPRPRGHAFAIALFLIALLSSVGALTWSKLRAEQDAAARDDRRLRLMWLARSAAFSAQVVEKTVQFGGREVRVSVAITPDPKPSTTRSVVAEASEGSWGAARIEARLDADGRRTSWRETWTSPPTEAVP